jgi:hypothetical protein
MIHVYALLCYVDGHYMALRDSVKLINDSSIV